MQDIQLYNGSTQLIISTVDININLHFIIIPFRAPFNLIICNERNRSCILQLYGYTCQNKQKHITNLVIHEYNVQLNGRARLLLPACQNISPSYMEVSRNVLDYNKPTVFVSQLRTSKINKLSCIYTHLEEEHYIQVPISIIFIALFT